MSQNSSNYSELSLAQKRELAKKLLVRRTSPTGSGVNSISPPVKSSASPTHCRFDLFPEYQRLQEQRAEAKGSGVIKANPYFVPHEGISCNRVHIAGHNLTNFSGYNYLGLSGEQRVSDAAIEAIKVHGTSVSASRIVCGEIPLHAALESAIAKLLEVEACAVFVSGWATNVSTIGHLLRPGDLILHDALVHNSAMMGCILSGARRVPFPHNDMAELQRLLAENRHHHERTLIVVEGVYSMDGDIAPLPDLITIKNKFDCLLMVDEAHSIGTLGATGGGIREHYGVAGSDVDIWMGTLSKAFASCGGYIAGSNAMVDNLKYLCSGMVYSVGLPPSNTAAALTAIEVMRQEPERVHTLRQRSQLFLDLAKRKGLNTGPSKGSPVVPIILGSSIASMAMSLRLFECGIEAKPVLYPAVAESEARVRFFITALHTEQEIVETVDVVAAEHAKLASSG